MDYNLICRDELTEAVFELMEIDFELTGSYFQIESSF